MGVPGLAGFISKWNLAAAAVESGQVFAYIGIGALLLSALLTAIYMLTIVVRAFFPVKDFDYKTLEGIKEPNWRMLLPLGIFCFLIIFFGLYSAPITDLLTRVSEGLL